VFDSDTIILATYYYLLLLLTRGKALQ